LSLKTLFVRGTALVGTRGIARLFVHSREHDSEKPVLDVIGDGSRFSDKIMLEQNYAAMAELVDALA
jgi:hypothetical protein